MTSPERLIIFDGDNTLWNVEALYDGARAALGLLVQGGAITAEEVESFQRTTDKALHREMGYSAGRFPRSFADTAKHFLDEGDPKVAQARQLAEEVFTSTAAPTEDVDGVLERLSKSHRLALLTAGPQDIQERRLEHFGRRHYFSVIRIVERKDQATISGFVRELGAVPALSWMVGDSLRSDIVPAIASGLRAIHLKTVNWHEVEVAEMEVPQLALSAQNLREAERLINDDLAG